MNEKSMGFKKEGEKIIAHVMDGEEVLGTFILDREDQTQIEKAESLGVDMNYAWYVYQYVLMRGGI